MAIIRTEAQLQMTVEGGIYVGVLAMLMFSLQLLIKLARIQMQPRPKYVKPEPLFKNYDAGQNWNWDWVMVFQVHGPNDYISDYQRHYSLRRIVERLEMGGLETKLFKSYSYDKIFCKIRCSAERLKDQAADVDYPLLMDMTEVRCRIERGYRDEFGKYKWYPRRAGWKLVGEDEDGEKLEKTFDNSIVDSEGQSGYIFNEHIYGKYDKRPDLQSPSVYVTYPASNSIFRSVDRLKLIMGIMEGDIKQEGCSLVLKELVTRGACLAIYPLHDDDALQTIQDRWLTYLEPPWAQPIDLVKDYFGEKVGMYFLFLGTYTSWLTYAAVLGAQSYLLEIIPSPLATWSTAICGLVMSLWSTVFLEAWKGVQARATMTWGMTGFEGTEQDRTEFEGHEIHSPVTGLPDAYFPDSEKSRRITCSYLQVLLCMVYVSAVNSGVFYVYAYVSRWPIEGYVYVHPFFTGNFSLTRIICNFTLAMVIQLTNGYFMPFATRMNFIENHRTETAFEDALIAKVFVFQFVNSYGALFYVAMSQAPLATMIGETQPWKTQRFSCEPRCLGDVGALLGTIFIIRVVMGNYQEVITPYLARVQRDMKNKKQDDNDDSEYENPSDPARMRKRQVSPAEEQYEKDDYDFLSLFDDYGEMVIQFGYTTLFVSAFPLAPMFACVANFIEIRVDGWKMCQNTRRPWPAGAEDIGTWESILTIMSILATITNGLMITQTSPTFAALPNAHRLVIFVLLEWFLVGVKIVLMAVFDDVPDDVEMQIERQEFLISKIILNERDEEKDLGDDELFEIEEPPVFSCDPGIQDPNKKHQKDGDNEKKDEKKEDE